jgi:hypothetical protein
MTPVSTPITVRVIARGGKFLGDDIGGAQVVIRDVYSTEVLAQGRTTGGSGPPEIMTAAITRRQQVPTQQKGNDACAFTRTLMLAEPRLVEISAFGPLGAQQSANRVSATTWILPGTGIAPFPSPGGLLREDGFLLEIPGLLVQAISPPQHYLPTDVKLPKVITIQANVTMMCGCPIDQAPWPQGDFQVGATVLHHGKTTEVPLDFLPNAGMPSLFSSGSRWSATEYGIYEIAIHAFQTSTGNTGVDHTTVSLLASAG